MGDSLDISTFVLNNALPPAHAGLWAFGIANPAFACGFTLGFILTLALQAEEVTHYILMIIETFVPIPGFDSIFSFPPSRRVLSAIPIKPKLRFDKSFPLVA